MNEAEAIDAEALSLADEWKLAAVCDRFEAAWQATSASCRPPQVEDYLAEAPTSGRLAFFRELLLLDIEYRRRQGAQPAALGPANAALAPFDLLAPPQEPGELGRLGAYRVSTLLGAGGMGIVFEAEDPRLKRKVALKAMKPALAASEAAKKRFLREAQATAAIKHDHIVTIYQVDEDHGVPFLAMEFLEGMSLEDWLKKGRKATPAEIVRVGSEIARGLEAAHQRGLAHRDIKPANIWLEAPHGRVKILDFGLARGTNDDANLTQAGDIVGTPAYMAPEQACNSSKVDRRADLFSLGCVLYHLCTGQRPFKGDTPLATLMAVVADNPRPVRELNAAIPPSLADLVMRLLAKDPAGRPASAQAVVKKLQAIERSENIQPGLVPLLPSRWPEVCENTSLEAALPVAALLKRKRDWRWPLALAAAVLLLAFGGVILRIKTRDGETETVASTNINQNRKTATGQKPATTPRVAALPPIVPPSAKAYRERGLASVDKKAWEQAIADFDEAVRLDPRDDFAFAARGFVYLQLGKNDQVIADSTTALQINPSQHNAYNNRGTAHANKQEYDLALTDFNEAIRLEPNKGVYYRQRGINQARRGDPEQALADFDRAIELDPMDSRALYQRHSIYLKRKSYDKALADLDKALQINKDPAFLNSRARVFGEMQEYHKALADLDEAVLLDPKTGSHYRERARILIKLAELDKAIADVNRAIELNPQDSEAYNERHILYLRKKAYGQALEDISQALALDPNNPVLYFNRGHLLASKQQQYDRARADLDDAIRLAPKVSNYYRERGRVLVKLGKPDKALTDFDRAIELNPKDFTAFNDRHAVYLSKKDYSKALEDVTEAIKLKPDEAVFFSNRAGIYEHLKEYDHAIADLTTAIRLNPKNPRLYEWRGQDYDLQGDKERAEADRKEAARLKEESSNQ